MPPKNNPLRLNTLQCKTLALFQALAQDPHSSEPDDDSGGVRIVRFPHAHGDHFHVGAALVMASDATGLGNESVWRALERKGLIKAAFPGDLRVTPAGQAYETGVADAVLHRGGH
ncbi:MAG: hypothetical protein O2905_00595 [Proteobacteria bacterium]|nr:hypothetical protein [Pseudomonadota bacterium]